MDLTTRIGPSSEAFFLQKNRYNQLGAHEVVKLCAKHGFGIELFTSKVGFVPYTDDDVRIIRDVAQELPFITAHTGIGPWNVEALEQEIATCSRLDIPILVVHGSTLGVENSSVLPDMPAICKLAAQARERQVTLALENGRSGLQTVLSVVAHLGGDPGETGFGICIDTGRAALADDCAQHSVTDYIRRVVDYLVHIHLHDIIDKQAHVLPGEGRLDWPDIGSSLVEIGYSGNFILEADCGDDPMEDLCEVREFLNKAFCPLSNNAPGERER